MSRSERKKTDMQMIKMIKKSHPISELESKAKDM